MRALQTRWQIAVRAAVGIMFAVALSGCSGAQLADRLPAPVGLPEGTPERPKEALVYPAVHDMPPERETTTLTPAEQGGWMQQVYTQLDPRVPLLVWFAVIDPGNPVGPGRGFGLLELDGSTPAPTAAYDAYRAMAP